MTTQKHSRRKRPTFTLLAVQCAAILIGSLLLALGVLGFVPGITTNTESLSWLDHQSSAAVFGVFAVSVLHNLFHIGVGLAGLVFARTYARARTYLLVGGATFLGLWVYLLIGGHSADTSDMWLHFGLGVAMVILAVTLAGARVPTGAGGEELPTAPQ